MRPWRLEAGHRHGSHPACPSSMGPPSPVHRFRQHLSVACAQVGAFMFGPASDGTPLSSPPGVAGAWHPHVHTRTRTRTQTHSFQGGRAAIDPGPARWFRPSSLSSAYSRPGARKREGRCHFALCGLGRTLAETWDGSTGSRPKHRDITGLLGQAGRYASIYLDNAGSGRYAFCTWGPPLEPGESGPGPAHMEKSSSYYVPSCCWCYGAGAISSSFCLLPFCTRDVDPPITNS